MSQRLAHFIVALSTLGLAACSADAPAREAATLVLRNGHVVTVDSAKPEAQAIAVRGSTILAVGTNAEINRFVGDSTEVIDLNGRLALPGFIESHGHFMGLGRAKMILDLTIVKNWEEIVTMVSAATRDARKDAWITGRGWHQEKWDHVPPGAVEGNPVHAELSRVSPDNPVYLTHASGHASFANQRALDLAGITRSTGNPPGGEIVNRTGGTLERRDQLPRRRLELRDDRFLQEARKRGQTADPVVRDGARRIE
jgi:predicted amidohydrolase YtcJ